MPDEGMDVVLLGQIRSSDTCVRSEKLSVYMHRSGKEDIEIRPSKVGQEDECWIVGEKEIPGTSLVEALIVGMEILNRA